MKRYFSELNDGTVIIPAENISADQLEDIIDEAADRVEEETGSREFASLYRDNFAMRLFSEIEEKANSGEEGEVDIDAAAEDALADTAAQVEEAEEAETKVQSLFNANPYLGAFVRAFSEAKEEGANDEEATVEAAKAALDEAGVPNAEVADEEVEAIKVQSYIRSFSDAGLEFTGEDLADLDPELGGQELLDFHQETEDKAEEIAANVNELLDENGFRLEPKADVSGINELI